MMSFRISISPSRRAAARFIGHVRRSLQKALEEERQKRGLTQSDIARTIGVHRSVINRELQGKKDISVGRIAELGFALGRVPEFSLPEAKPHWSANVVSASSDTTSNSIPIQPPYVHSLDAA